MNGKRVITGGLLAALTLTLLDALQFLIALRLQDVPWGELLRQVGAPLVSQALPGLVGGMLLSWLYALARPRLGPGPKTALRIGSIAWALVMQPFFNPMTWLNAPGLTFAFVLLSWIKYVAATYVAGWQYIEKAPS